jgi:hypothetical protein
MRGASHRRGLSASPRRTYTALLTWDLLQPGQFTAMLETRTRWIHERALTLFGMKSADFDALFVTT